MNIEKFAKVYSYFAIWYNLTLVKKMAKKKKIEKKKNIFMKNIDPFIGL